MVFFLAQLAASAVRGVAHAVGVKEPAFLKPVLDVIAPTPQQIYSGITGIFAKPAPSPVLQPARRVV